MKTVVDGITFASKKEAKRYGELKLLESAGEIDRLILQPAWDLCIREIKICRYIGDFQYRDRRSMAVVVEDVKGMKTPVYKIKKLLMAAIKGIGITEV